MPAVMQSLLCLSDPLALVRSSSLTQLHSQVPWAPRHSLAPIQTQSCPVELGFFWL